MRRERWFGAAVASLISFGAALGAVSCLYSGMGMQINLHILLLVLGLGAVVAGVCSVFRWYLLPVGMTVAAGILCLQPLIASVRGLLQHIFLTYQQAYHWGVPAWLQGPVADATLALCLVGLLLTSALTTAVMSGRGVGLAVLTCVLPVLPCCVVTDRVPGEMQLYTLLFSLLILLMSQHVRRKGLQKWTLAVLYLVLPVALGLGALFHWLPQDGYRLDQDAGKLKKTVITMLQENPWLSELTSDVIVEQLAQQEQVDLSGVTINPELGLKVMSVKVPTTGYLYLRGSTYDTYTGMGWENSGFDLPSAYPTQGQTRYVTIRTKHILDVLYLPYVAEALPGTIQNGRLYNYDQVREYNLAYREPAEYDVSWDKPAGYAYPEEVAKTCLQLPAETRLWSAATVPAQATALLTEGKVHAAALQIGAYVRGSARYDRMTSAMPTGRADFAKWFWEESDRGYCVHFATTAVVLLRAAGIPARYVTGYVVQAEQDLFAEVTTNNAHAWVEYFVPEVGWTVLEVSPAEGEILNRPNGSEGTVVMPAPSETGPTQVTYPTIIYRPPTPAQKSGKTPWILLTVVLILTLIPVQWQLRLSLRRRGKRTGSTNARLLVCWREVEQLCHLQKICPPEALHALAQKARFSQYTITRQELAYFEKEGNLLRDGLKTHPWYLQLVYRLVFALY